MNYGEAGLNQTLDYLSKNARPRTVISVRKDIYYYLFHRQKMQVGNVTLGELFGMNDVIPLRQLILLTPFDYLVLDGVSLAYTRKNPMIGEELALYFHPAAEYGDFKILRSNRLKDQ